MKSNKTVKVVQEEDIVEYLSMRTGMGKDLIHTLLHYYNRIILHNVGRGNTVKIDSLLIIYTRAGNVEISLTQKAKREIKKGRN